MIQSAGIVRGYLMPHPPLFERAKIISLSDAERITDELLASFTNMVSDLHVKDESSLDKFCSIFVCAIMGSFSDRKHLFVKSYLEGYDFDRRYQVRPFQEALRELPAENGLVGNTSSLLIHLLASSAIACAIARTRKIAGIEYQILRCAALFHSIGKLCFSESCEKPGEEKFKRFFGSIFSDDLLGRILAVMDIQKESAGELGEILKVSSEFSIAADQMKEVAVKYAKEHFEERVWEPTAIHTTRLVEATKDYLGNKDEFWMKRLEELAARFRSDEESEVALVIGDARGIKKYVDKSNTIYEIKGGSHRVEEGINRAAMHLLKEDLIEPENLIFFAGGGIYFSCSSTVLDKVKTETQRAFTERAKGAKISVSSVKVPIRNPPPFGVVWNGLCRKSRREKDSQVSREIVLNSLVKLCDSCHERPATKGYRDYLYCDICAEKVNEGRSLVDDIRPQQPLSEYIPEFLAGHKLPEIVDHDEAIHDPAKGRHIESYLNLAVIKADVNLSGEFFARSASLSELIEKSASLEQAMDETKEEIRKMVSSLRGKEEHEEKEYEWRFEIGTVYSAGDDFLMFAPSFMAYPLALNLIKKFYEKMGKTCRLSVGISACDPRYPIQSLMEVAEEEVGLGKAEDARTRFEEDREYAGSLSYEVIVGGAFSGRLAQSTLELMKKKGLTARPLLVFENEQNSDPRNALTLARETLKIDDPFSIQEYASRFNELREDRLKHDWTKTKSRLAAIASIIRTDEGNVENDRKLAILASMRQSARMERDEGYLLAFNLLEPPAVMEKAGRMFSKPARIFDALALLKLCGGGVL
jgi:hypothetical protein